jgi:hypothetical protein
MFKETVRAQAPSASITTCSDASERAGWLPAGWLAATRICSQILANFADKKK